jgi:CoA:oxalate CoA-transferase
MSPKPPMLTGYRVLDITQFVAGPTCTRILAELGADVIKIELAPYGDRSRIQGLKPRNRKGSSQSTYFFQHNHSKRSLALQWKHPRSTAILKALIAGADVLVENFAPRRHGASGSWLCLGYVLAMMTCVGLIPG